MHHPDARFLEENKYSFALAEFSYGKLHGPDLPASGVDALFYAKFDKPVLEFICNHDAILRLKIKEGYYNQSHKVYTRTAAEDVRLPADLELTFRLGFDVRKIIGEDSKIGKSQNLIQLVILDLKNAKLISSKPELHVGRESLLFYFSKYLEFLHGAGHHVLFSLPDFDDDRFRLNIDFSLMRKPHVTTDNISGISLDRINSYLSFVWLKSAMLAHNASAKVVDWRSTCLAEYSSINSIHGDSEIHFQLKLGPPRIEALCSREVIMYFRVREASFFHGVDFTTALGHKYTDWEIAVVIDVIYTAESGGDVVTIKLDLKNARFNHQCSKFTGFDSEVVHAETYLTRLIEFFSIEYLELLQIARYDTVYSWDKDWVIRTPVIGGGSDDSSWGVEEVIALSQNSINAHFDNLWANAQSQTSSAFTSHILAKWNYEHYFSATFRPLTVRLLSNGKALIWVHLAHGFLKTLKDWFLWSEGKHYDFEDWRLAFEVDLKMCSHRDLVTDVSEKWLNEYKESVVFKEHGSQQDRVLKHLYLDLHDTEFLHEFSTFEGLYDAQDNECSIEQLQAVVYYIQHHYFKDLRDWGLNILYTLPIWHTGISLTSYALTDVAFHIYSMTDITRRTWPHVSAGLEPLIVLVGMTGFRPLPATHLEFYDGWVFHTNKKQTYGTVSISKRVFMGERLLSILSHLNAVTTIVPVFSGVENGVWALKLTTWAQHEWRKNHAYKLQFNTERDGYLKYKWEHRDGWSYEHEGSSDIVNGTYSVSFPTAFRRGALEIKVWGEVKLDMSFKAGTEKWSATSSATWDAMAAVRTNSHGIKVDLLGARSPRHQDRICGGLRFGDVCGSSGSSKGNSPRYYRFQRAFERAWCLQGVWTYCYPRMQAYSLANPLFNAHGDLIFELRLHGQQVSSGSVLRQTSLGGPSLAVRGPSSRRTSSFLRTASGTTVTKFVEEAVHSVSYSDVVNGGNSVDGTDSPITPGAIAVEV
ncbi:hypothetical protein A0H81_11368 [Grifola frondosa]|uniref:Uncharacterized protein n=1 Tax=Grifola frondosa TaxID=5627 RepID=A0A1C7LXN2_GRIFR|nr:hypothetical protein A0H81_11368 [Grifola frondosa]